MTRFARPLPAVYCICISGVGDTATARPIGACPSDPHCPSGAMFLVFLVLFFSFRLFLTSPSAAHGPSCSALSPRWPSNMGKIIRGGEAWSQVKLSTRRAGGGGSCSVEFTAYLTCLDKTQANEEECKTLREALRRCMYAANAGPRASRHVVPINYHLQKVRRSNPSPLPCLTAPAHPVLCPITMPPPLPPRSLSRASRGDTASQYLFNTSCVAWVMMQLCAELYGRQQTRSAFCLSTHVSLCSRLSRWPCVRATL